MLRSIALIALEVSNAIFYAVILTLILFVMSGLARGQTHPSADFLFDDGSKVRMKLQSESLEVQTKFGKLTVPFSEIRRIEFGLHVPAETQEKIDKNVKRLGSSVMRERESACAYLSSFGYVALPSLRLATKSTDAETSRRAANVVAKIAETTLPTN